MDERVSFRIFFKLERLRKPANEDFKDWQKKTCRPWAAHEELPLVEYFPYVLIKYANGQLAQGEVEDDLRLRQILKVHGLEERFSLPDQDVNGDSLATWMDAPPEFVISKKLYEVRDRLIINGELTKKFLTESCEGRDLFREIKARFRFFCDLDEHWCTLLALWSMGTHVYRAFSAYPYIFLWAEAGSGKTRILKTATPLVHMGKHVEDPSAASAFRMVDAVNATLLIDEADKLTPEQNSELLGILNTGYELGATVSRYNMDKKMLEEFNAYSPKMLASNRTLGNSLESRCLRIPLQRSSNQIFGEREPNDELHRLTATDIHQDLTIWAIDQGSGIVAADRKEVMDKYRERFKGAPIRLIQIMLPILVIYDVIGIDESEADNLTKIINYQCAEKTSESVEEASLRILNALADCSEDNIKITTKAIIVKLELEKDETKDFKPARVGNVLRKYNIPNRTVNGRKEYLPNMKPEERQLFLAKIFGKYSITRIKNERDETPAQGRRDWEDYT
jgi:hypothetical protein